MISARKQRVSIGYRCHLFQVEVHRSFVREGSGAALELSSINSFADTFPFLIEEEDTNVQQIFSGETSLAALRLLQSDEQVAWA